MIRRTTVVVVVLIVLLAVAVGTAIATSSSGVTAETARGPLVDRPLDAHMNFGPGTKVKLSTQGAMEVAVQRITATPGASFGWHTHPGPTIVTVLSGTLTLYHAEHCTEGINYGPGTSFSNLPAEVHLARNNGAIDLVIFASYFVPVGTGPLRIDQPSPGPDCPL